MSDQHQEFPRYLTHPHFRPATLGTSDDDRKGIKGSVGKPMQFPPVTVNNETQLEYHLAQGYVPSGKMDPAAFTAAMAVPDDAQAPGTLMEFPKWVYSADRRKSAIAQDDGEEAILRARFAAEEVEEAQHEKDEADRAAREAGTPTDTQAQIDSLRDGLQAVQQGQDEVKGMLALLLEKATAPAPPAPAQTGKSGRGDKAA